MATEQLHRLDAARARYQAALAAHHRHGTTITLAALQAAEDLYREALLDWADGCGLTARLPK